MQLQKANMTHDILVSYVKENYLVLMVKTTPAHIWSLFWLRPSEHYFGFYLLVMDLLQVGTATAEKEMRSGTHTQKKDSCLVSSLSSIISIAVK